MSSEKLIKLRHHLHSIAEVSGAEHQTADFIEETLQSYQPDEILTGIGGTGIIARFKGNSDGPVILIRCELDALPIKEENELDYISKKEGVGHKCGHDGHMAILCGVAEWLSEKDDLRGEVLLLFQPAEETGEGAEKMLKDERFTGIKPDYVFALHNIPGYERNQIILKNSAFAAASVGMKIVLKGKTSHAAHPDEGVSPALAVAQLIQAFSALPQFTMPMGEDAKVTITHARVGEQAFGISPGEATLMATLRTFDDDSLEALKTKATQLAEDMAHVWQLEVNITWSESFAVTWNDEEAVHFIRSAASENDLTLYNKETPFGWSEDFGRFTQQFKGAMFGLGSGKDHPALHASDYDFPDEIIETGIKMFKGIIQAVSSLQ